MEYPRITKIHSIGERFAAEVEFDVPAFEKDWVITDDYRDGQEWLIAEKVDDKYTLILVHREGEQIDKSRLIVGQSYKLVRSPKQDTYWVNKYK